MRFSTIASTAFLTFAAGSYAAATPTLGDVVVDRTDSSSCTCASGSASGSGELGTLLSGFLSGSGNTEILDSVVGEIETVLQCH
jgi:hypothetical protein